MLIIKPNHSTRGIITRDSFNKGQQLTHHLDVKFQVFVAHHLEWRNPRAHDPVAAWTTHDVAHLLHDTLGLQLAGSLLARQHRRWRSRRREKEEKGGDKDDVDEEEEEEGEAEEADE